MAKIPALQKLTHVCTWIQKITIFMVKPHTTDVDDFGCFDHIKNFKHMIKNIYHPHHDHHKGCIIIYNQMDNKTPLSG